MSDLVLGIDVGGSGIKGALVDLEKGAFASERIKILTPAGFPLAGVVETMATLVRQFDYSGPVGVGFPAAVADGVVLTPPTALNAPGWMGKSVETAVAEATGCRVTVINDADAAGVAEMAFGAGKGQNGTVMTFTLGTGVGCGMFMDGKLVPNFELGKLYLQGQKEAAELFMAGRIRKDLGLPWAEYGARLNEYFQHIEFLFSPQLMILGGGISKKADKYIHYVELSRSRLVTATLRNQAGIVGAAVAAVQNG